MAAPCVYAYGAPSAKNWVNPTRLRCVENFFYHPENWMEWVVSFLSLVHFKNKVFFSNPVFWEVHLRFEDWFSLSLFVVFFANIFTGSCLSSILSLGPSKTRSFPIKTRVIWVPGIYYSVYLIWSDLNYPYDTILSLCTLKDIHRRKLRGASSVGRKLFRCCRWKYAGETPKTSQKKRTPPKNQRLGTWKSQFLRRVKLNL